MWVKFYDSLLATGVVLVVRQCAMAKSDFRIENQKTDTR